MAVAVASIIGGAIVNALAFTGSQVAAKALGGDSGSMEKVKRHDDIDKLNARLAAEGTATIRLDDHVEASRLFKEVMSNKGRQIDDSLLNISPRKLSDYYVPSEDQKVREYVFVTGGAITGALIVYFYNRSG